MTYKLLLQQHTNLHKRSPGPDFAGSERGVKKEHCEHKSQLENACWGTREWK